MTSQNDNPWVSIPNSMPQAHLRLFCFSYAGGSAGIYYSWFHYLKDVEVCAIQYPGREKRILEPLLSDFRSMVDALVPAILPLLTKPFAFFGHSLGAIICFELAHRLYDEYALSPQHLFVAAHRAPQLPDPRPSLHQLPLDEFKKELQRLGGTPQSILANAELMNILLPILRADFAVGKTFVYSPRKALGCAISAFGGEQDFSVSQQELEGWQSQTTGSFSLKMFKGGHFFIHTEQTPLLASIAQGLEHTLQHNNEADRDEDAGRRVSNR